MNKEMAVEDTDDTLSVSSADLTDMLMASRDFLNSSRFDEAETAFLKLYKEIQVTCDNNYHRAKDFTNKIKMFIFNLFFF